MAGGFTSEIYTFVVTAYATLAVTQYSKNSTTARIKTHKSEAKRAWENDFKDLHEDGDKAPDVRSERDEIDNTDEDMGDRPLKSLFVCVVLASFLMLWNVSAKALHLENPRMDQALGCTVMVLYIVLFGVLMWIGWSIYKHRKSESDLKKKVQTWKGKAEVCQQTAIRTAQLEKEKRDNQSPSRVRVNRIIP